MLHQSCHSLHKPQQHSAAGPRALHSTFRSFRPLQPPYRPDVMSSHPRVGQLPQQAPSVSSINTNKVHKLSTADVGTSLHSSPAQDLTELAGRILQDGNGVARRVLSDPDLEGNPLDFLKQTEAFWKAMKQQQHEPHKKGPTVITTSSSSTISSILASSSHTNSNHSSSSSRPPSFGAAPAAPATSHSAASSVQQSRPDFDVVMCGGTLGICMALALQQQGLRVAVVEKRRVEGRLQEWNSSRHEMQVLVDMGLLTQEELEAAIISEFNPIRVGFKGAAEPLTINNVLNIGVCPKTLIATMRAKFEVLGGVIYEHTAFKSGVVGTDGVVVSLMNAAGTPADVGDTNRPNAMQHEQPVHLHSPFGRVAGAGSGAAAVAAAAAAAVHHSNDDEAQQHHSSSNSSRYDRWVAAAAAGSEDIGLTAGSSHGSSSDSSHARANGRVADTMHVHGQHSSSNGGTGHAEQSRAAAAAASGQAGGRRAPGKLTCRLLLDCMGHYSPIVKQLRGKAKPDGMVLVVGGCATGFAPEQNTSADLLYSITDAAADMQLFWEAFPAEGGASRTTYMFAYSDADSKRPSFEKLLDTYFTLMPAYQGLPSLDAVKYKRVLFGGFPCYSSTTPLGPGFDRVLQLGDASASQSPLSFGGFGSMLRHLRRLSGAIGHALQDDKLSRQDLSWIHPYQPSLSAAWLFQRSMSMQVGQQQQQQQQQHKMPSMQQHLGDAAALGVAGTAAAAAAGHEKPAAAATGAMSAVATGAGAAAAAPATPDAATTTTSSKPSWLQQLLKLPANHINALLGANFAVMAFLGQRVMKPFLQDTLQLGPLAATMFGMMLVKPLVISRVLVQVGPKVLLGWFGHFAMLTAYSLAYHMLRPFKHISSSYRFQRLLDALKYGSSSDYHYSSAAAVNRGVSTSSSSSGGGAGGNDGQVQQQRKMEEAGVVVQPGVVGGGQVNGVRQRREGVANNILPAVPPSWVQHEVVQQHIHQQQPSGA